MNRIPLALCVLLIGLALSGRFTDLVSSNVIDNAKPNIEETMKHAVSEKIAHEPKAIIAYQKNNSAKAKRTNINNRFGLVEARLREIEQNENLETAFAQIDTYVDNLQQQYKISPNMDQRLILNPLERIKYDQKQYAAKERELRESLRTLRRQQKSGKILNAAKEREIQNAFRALRRQQKGGKLRVATKKTGKKRKRRS